MKQNSFIITDDGVSGVINGTLFNVDVSNQNYAACVSAIRKKEWDEALRVSNLARAVQKFTTGSDIVVDADEGSITFNGQELNNTLTARILRMMEDGFDVTPMTNFLRNLMKNPSKRSVDELYDFLEKGNLPITEDGCFIAYKRVGDDYYDIHSHTVCAKPAELMSQVEYDSFPKVNVGSQKNVTIAVIDNVTTISMPRNAVDDRKENTCSDGLHFCSHEYLKSFSGSRVIIMKINPADVVSIPADYNSTKGRTWKYQVIGELNETQKVQAEKENILTQSVFVKDNMDEANWSVDFIKGYKMGHKDGRSHSARVWYAEYCVNAIDDEVKGYGVGYLDGKNKVYDKLERLEEMD